MTARAAAVRLALALAIAGTLAAPAAAEAPTPLLSGPAAGGGSWTLAGEHTRLSAVTGICLHVSATVADGTSPGEAVVCAAGSLHGAHNVVPVAGRARSGGTTTSYVLGGLTVSRAATVRLTFAGGAHRELRTQAPPSGWSTAMGAHVRYFGADLLALSHATLRSVTAYDRHHRRVGGAPHVVATPLR